MARSKKTPAQTAGPQDAYGADTFTPEGEVIKQTPPPREADTPRDPELQAIIDSEIAAIDASPTLQVAIRHIFAGLDSKAAIKKALDFYKEIGGDPQKLKRGFQITVDQAIAEELLNTDLPGPDMLQQALTAKIREFVVLAIGKKFDEFIS